MIKHTGTFGGMGAALLGAFALAGCTNYMGAVEPAPQILGVMVQDANDNEFAPPGYCSVNQQTCSVDADCTGHCSTATLEICSAAADCTGSCSNTTAWGCAVAADCPGFCVADTARGCSTDDDCAPGDTCDSTTGQTCDTTAQTCVTTPAETCVYAASGSTFDWPYPPRDGPVWSATFVGGSVPPQATWSLGTAAPLAGGVPSGPWPSPKYGPFLFARPRIVFNKLMDGASIQPDPTVCAPTANITVMATPTGGTATNVTADFGVCYDPASTTASRGASVWLSSAAGRLRSDTTYAITGTVKDKGGTNTAVDFTIKTAP